MENLPPIGQLRATIFTAPIVYDGSNLKRISDLLPSEDDYVPKTFPANQFVPGFPIPNIEGQMPIEWEMFSSKSKLTVHFGPQKIDITKNTFINNEHSEKEFCKIACDIFVGIIDRFKLAPTRLAYAPVYTPDWTPSFNKKGFNEKIYAKNKFKNSALNNLLFKQGYVVEETLNGNPYYFNYVAEASEGQNIEEIKPGSLRIKLMLNLSLDINTLMGKNYVFGIDEVKDFFNNATVYGENFLEYYIG